MKDDVKLSINGRKDSMFQYFEITDDIKVKIDDLFKRIEEFGKTCTDSTDFETKFASSDLNQEYINLYTEIGTKCKSKIATAETVDVKKEILEDVDYEMKEAVDSVGRRARRKANEELMSKARSTPIIGDVLEAKQYHDLFSRFKKNKDDDNKGE